MNPIFDAVSGVFSSIMAPITTVVDGWQQRSTAQLTSDLKVKEALTTAKVNFISTQQAGDIAWENTALATSGWKSGYLTLLLSIPMVLCFIPGMVQYVKDGFTALDHVPGWYQSAIGVMIAADFGYKKFADMMSLKNGVPMTPTTPPSS